MGEPKVGEAYRGSDGVVRWVRGKSTRGYFSCLWLAEDLGVWYSGGKYRANDFPMGESYPPPQPGDIYKSMGVYGRLREVRA